MTIHCKIKGTWYRIEEDVCFDLSIPLYFNAKQPNAFSLPKATSRPAAIGSFTGDTRKGASCNATILSLAPHGNGTHTECVGHLTKKRFFLPQICQKSFLPATLISVLPTLRKGRRVISRKLLENAFFECNPGFQEALLVRTLPNNPGKKQKSYSGRKTPYFEPDAVLFLRDSGVNHLLTDLPSIDQESDPALPAHRIFWDLPRGKDNIPKPPSHRTITEMIFAENKITDGIYLLNLQFPPFMEEAAPSRPLLFPLKKVSHP